MSKHMADEQDIEREAKRRFALSLSLPNDNVPWHVEMVWSLIDESERTQYRLDAVAALNAITPGE